MSGKHIPTPSITPGVAEKYEHIFDTYMTLWNEALNYIYDTQGAAGMEAYNRRAMDKTIMSRAVFTDIGEGVGATDLLKSFLSHHLMMDSQLEVLSASEDAIVVDIVVCGSKSRLMRNIGAEKSRHYCEHCKNLRFYEQIGWEGRIDTEGATHEQGENIGCRRTFVRLHTASHQGEL